jgi:hypothetical protein
VIEVKLRGLDVVEKYIAALPEQANTALRLAVNKAALDGARKSKRRIMDQVNLSSEYIGNPANRDARLAVIRKASGHDLEAIIEARERPTSLARFATGAAKFGKQTGNIRVRVKRGKTRVLKKAFFVRLKSGKELTQENYNVGLAIRLKAGETINNKRDKVMFKPGIALLYGPSVQQVFQSVSEEVAPEVRDIAEREFLRQFARLTK